jgi:FixJ family two-component response regulator
MHCRARPRSLLDAIDSAIQHSRAVLERDAADRALEQRYAALSRRERQVMALVVQGKANKCVAGDLGISEITVKAHRGKVMRKMMARSIPDLVMSSARLVARGCMEPSGGISGS